MKGTRTTITVGWILIVVLWLSLIPLSNYFAGLALKPDGVVLETIEGDT